MRIHIDAGMYIYTNNGHNLHGSADSLICFTLDKMLTFPLIESSWVVKRAFSDLIVLISSSTWVNSPARSSCDFAAMILIYVLPDDMSSQNPVAA